MQKFLAIFAALALVATSVFAVDISAGGHAGFRFVGATEKDTEIAPQWGDYFWVSFGMNSNDDNTAGAKGSIGGSSKGTANIDWLYAWWRPMDVLFLKLGKLDEEGQYWWGNGLMGWDLNSNDSQDIWLGAAAGYAGPGPWGLGGWWNDFPGAQLGSGFGNVGRMGHGDKTGVQLSILPVDGAHLTFAWNLAGDGNIEKDKRNIAGTLVNDLSLQVGYSIPGAGNVAISFVNADADDKSASRHVGVFYGQGIGDMTVNFDADIPLPIDGDIPGIRLGVGFGMGGRWGGGYMGEQFQLRARLGAFIGLMEGEPTVIGFEAVPTYDLGIMRFWAGLGLSVGLPKEGDTEIDWSFYPYITKDLGIGDLYFGITLYSYKDGAGDSAVGFSIPLGYWFNL